MDFIGNQTVQGPNESFSAASKGFKIMKHTIHTVSMTLKISLLDMLAFVIFMDIRNDCHFMACLDEA